MTDAGNDRRRVRVHVELDWKQLGDVVLEEGRLKFPEGAPKLPGIYRFSLRSPEGDAVYVGEASLLDRRFVHYRNPGPTQTTNQWVNAEMKRILAAGGAVFVDVATEVEVAVGGAAVVVDLSHRPYRLLAENAALIVARQAGEQVKNL